MQQRISARADAVRTQKQEQRRREAAERRKTQSKGLTREEFWDEEVKTEADAVRYYEIFFPDYPRELALALARTATERLKKELQEQEQLSPEQKTRRLMELELQAAAFRQQVREQEEKQVQNIGKRLDITGKWNYVADIAEQRAAGLAARDEKAISQLLELVELDSDEETRKETSCQVEELDNNPTVVLKIKKDKKKRKNKK